MQILPHNFDKSVGSKVQRNFKSCSRRLNSILEFDTPQSGTGYPNEKSRLYANDLNVLTPTCNIELSLASLAMGHRGTCPARLPTIYFFSVQFTAARKVSRSFFRHPPCPDMTYNMFSGTLNHTQSPPSRQILATPLRVGPPRRQHDLGTVSESGLGRAASVRSTPCRRDGAGTPSGEWRRQR